MGTVSVAVAVPDLDAVELAVKQPGAVRTFRIASDTGVDERDSIGTGTSAEEINRM